MRRLEIEWRHLDLDGGTCLRCSETGDSLHQVISEIREELETQGVELSFTETTLPEEDLPQSNLILINGRPLESILSGATAGENYCSSCSCLTGRDAYCRTISYDGETYEEIPAAVIKKAILATLDVNGTAEG